MSLRDWLLAARDDKMLYASPAERMIVAIGEQELLDTAQDPRLGRIFFNRTIKRYKAFEGFYGMEDTIERIVGYFKQEAQGLEEKRQILYLLGPVGGGKSSLAERLKEMMERQPIYVLKAGNQISPVLESPLGLFRSGDLAALLEDKYGIERHRLTGVMSPWAVKRLDEFSGDISKFEVARLYPSKLRQIAISKTEPGDENNQDISALVGKVDIRKLEHFSQNDPDAYSFSGGLCHANQGLLEFVEIVQGPDQGAASPAHGDPGRQLDRHGDARSHSLQRRYSRPLKRSRVAGLQGEQEQRSLPGPYLRHHGPLLPAGVRRSSDLQKAAQGESARQRALHTGNPGNARPLLCSDAIEGT